MPYEEISHTADVAIQVTGPDLSAIFEDATRAMFEIMYGQVPEGSESERPIEVGPGDVEELLWEWLSAVLSWSEVDRIAYVGIEITFEDDRAEGRVSGPSSEGLELSGPPIKAVTLHDMAVNGSEGAWEAIVVFDV